MKAPYTEAYSFTDAKKKHWRKYHFQQYNKNKLACGVISQLYREKDCSLSLWYGHNQTCNILEALFQGFVSCPNIHWLIGIHTQVCSHKQHLSKPSNDCQNEWVFWLPFFTSNQPWKLIWNMPDNLWRSMVLRKIGPHSVLPVCNLQLSQPNIPFHWKMPTIISKAVTSQRNCKKQLWQHKYLCTYLQVVVSLQSLLTFWNSQTSEQSTGYKEKLKNLWLLLETQSIGKSFVSCPKHISW